MSLFPPSDTHAKTAGKLLLIYVATVAVITIIAFYAVSTWINHHLESNLRTQKSRLYGILAAHKKLTENFFEREIITPPVIDLVRRMGKAEPGELAVLRDELYSQLANAYKWMTCYGVQQLHFHSADSHSLLRFHAREYSGDDLTNFRPSILKVRETHQPVHGYESGRIVHGFRHVFPLLDGDTYLGSVEICQSIRRIVSDLGGNTINGDEILYAFILKKADLENKLFPQQFRYYTPSLIDERYRCGSVAQEDGKPVPPKGVNNLSERLHRKLHQTKGIAEKIAREEDFILFPIITHHEYAVYFHSIRAIDNTHVAYLIMASNESHLSELYTKALLGVAMIALLLIFPFSYRYQLERERQNRIHTAEFLEVISQNMGEGVYATDTSGVITYINQTSCELLGWAANELIGKNAHNTFHDGHSLNKEGCLILKALSSPQETYKGCQQYRRKNGSLFPVEFLSKAMSGNNAVNGVVTVFRDISDQQARERQQQELTQQLEQANKELSRLARIDALTEVANRRKFDETLTTFWKSASREEKTLSLLMIDIDHFKAYNDQYGHPAGDAALKTVARVLLAACKRPGDIVTRYGGEEFAVLLPNTSLADACLVGQRIQALLADQQIPHSASAVANHLTVTIGAASCHAPQDAFAQKLVDAADECLYKAKIAGRNRIASTELKQTA
jgi:diguanylate cyclase (GGDEF)-like protein/PAS domain S-box-containing protein